MYNLVIKAVTPLLLLLVSLSQQSNATIITQTLEDQGAGMWLSNVEIINDALMVNIDEIVLIFDFNLYSNLSIVTSPIDWDPLVFQPEPLIPDDGIIDILALIAGLAPSETLTGLSVTFEWLGTANSPGALLFEILDPNTFNVISSGSTTLETTTAPTPVPAPPTLALFLLSLALTARYASAQKKVNHHV
jgi:hypothetical protein